MTEMGRNRGIQVRRQSELMTEMGRVITFTRLPGQTCPKTAGTLMLAATRYLSAAIGYRVALRLAEEDWKQMERKKGIDVAANPLFTVSDIGMYVERAPDAETWDEFYRESIDTINSREIDVDRAGVCSFASLPCVTSEEITPRDFAAIFFREMTLARPEPDSPNATQCFTNALRLAAEHLHLTSDAATLQARVGDVQSMICDRFRDDMVGVRADPIRDLEEKAWRDVEDARAYNRETFMPWAVRTKEWRQQLETQTKILANYDAAELERYQKAEANGWQQAAVSSPLLQLGTDEVAMTLLLRLLTSGKTDCDSTRAKAVYNRCWRELHGAQMITEPSSAINAKIKRDESPEETEKVYSILLERCRLALLQQPAELPDDCAAAFNEVQQRMEVQGTKLGGCHKEQDEGDCLGEIIAGQLVDDVVITETDNNSQSATGSGDRTSSFWRDSTNH